ncbi:MAG TPA: DUF364 domain-containing protein [Desulfohalobiaceae bacterium]|nr:DUF364 domain-containing protein [Desulfohalobiaceae bacterium]
MTSSTAQSVLETVRPKMRSLVVENNLLEVTTTILAKELSPEEAIGSPGRRDFPLIEGKERVIEATLLGAKGQAYTDSPREFTGSLSQVTELSLDQTPNRAIFLAALNALGRKIGLVSGTVHCKDKEPEECAPRIADSLYNLRQNQKIGLIGLNPAIAEALIDRFGPKQVTITDLQEKNINKTKWGAEIWDGRTETERLIRESDTIVITGTTMSNGTFDTILQMLHQYDKNYTTYGITGAAVCSLLEIPRICPFGRNE